jgi:predicted ATPase
MKLKKLPPQCIAPFRLKEITLHGIGSYYKPARLEIKPLTILCGTNGSGKSTWMKVLSTLKEALEPLRNDDGRVQEADYLERLPLRTICSTPG